MTSAGTPQGDAFDRHVNRQSLDRLTMLSDGVFAIAITLAALELHIPTAPDLAGVLAALLPRLVTYLISFGVIAVFWMSNRDLFARLRRVDRPLTVLVLMTLCFTALIPASVRITDPGQGSLGGAFQFYAVLMALSGTLNCLLWVYASLHPELMSPEVRRAYRVRRIAETATLPLLFAAIAIFPTVEMLKWIGVATAVVLLLRRVILQRLLAGDRP